MASHCLLPQKSLDKNPDTHELMTGTDSKPQARVRASEMFPVALPALLPPNTGLEQLYKHTDRLSSLNSMDGVKVDEK